MYIKQIWLDGEHWAEFKALCEKHDLAVRHVLSTVVKLCVTNEEFSDYIIECIQEQRVKIEVSVKEKTRLERERRDTAKAEEIKQYILERHPDMAPVFKNTSETEDK